MYYSLCYSNNFMNSSEKTSFIKHILKLTADTFYLIITYLSSSTFWGGKKKENLRKNLLIH